MQSEKASRPYASPMRVAAAAAKRQRVITAAMGVLREEAGIAAFSLEAIAARAGVTRLTVYNQFGSRRGVLEAVLDDLAARSALAHLADAADDPDPRRSLDRIVAIMCAFWNFDPAIGRLQDATALDRDFAIAVHDRTERRRGLIRSILQRLSPGQPAQRQRDTVDLIFALTAYATFSALSEGRASADVCGLLQRACRHAAAGGDGG